MQPGRAASPTPIRVAIVAASLRFVGGQAVQAKYLLDRWRHDPEIEVSFVPIDPVPTPPVDRLLRVKYARTVVTQLWYWPLLFRRLRHVDVVHVFSASYASFLLSPLPAILVATALRKPVLLNYHSGEAPDHLSRSRVARWVLRHLADSTVVPSTFLQEVFASFGLPCTVVSNGIDRERFGWRDRERLGPRLLSTRNFEELYNVACTIRAFARVQAVRPEASLTLVGSGSQEQALRALVCELGLDRVTFAGSIAPDDMPQWYDAADIYVQTPSIDNMPLSVLEAFASGLPVVSTGVGGVPAILTHGVHGLLAGANEAAQVADSVLHLLDHPEHARALARAARQSCDGYEWPSVRRAWVDAYRAAAARRPRQPAASIEAVRA
jgi:glycosyltransferase involved in cell wall biosynthesis